MNKGQRGAWAFIHCALIWIVYPGSVGKGGRGGWGGGDGRGDEGERVVGTTSRATMKKIWTL